MKFLYIINIGGSDVYSIKLSHGIPRMFFAILSVYRAAYAWTSSGTSKWQSTGRVAFIMEGLAALGTSRLMERTPSRFHSIVAT